MFFSKPSHETSLVIDIGSTSIGVALMHTPEGSLPHIIYSHRESILSNLRPGTKTFISSMCKLLDKALLEVHKTGFKSLKAIGVEATHLKTAMCSYSSPWHFSETKILKVRKDSEVIFSEQVLDGIIKKEEESFRENHHNKDLVIIDKKITHIKLNGYENSVPFGKKARNIDVSLFMSMMEKAVITRIEALIRKHIGVSHIYHHSFTIASFVAVTETFPKADNFLLLDIGGEITDLTVVKDTMPLDILSFPHGRNAIIRKVGEDCVTDPALSLSAIKTYLDKKVTSKRSTCIKKILESAKKEWVTSLQKALSEVSREIAVPKTIYVTCDDDLKSFFIDCLKDDALAHVMLVNDEFKICPLEVEEFDHHVPTIGSVKKDLFLTIDALLIHRTRAKSKN